MPYRYAVERKDLADFASGKVLHSLTGHPPLPVRLVSEILQRCLAIRRARGERGRLAIYDPCCGAAYHLTLLGLLHREAVGAVIGSDIDSRAVATAARNLALLSPQGVEERISELNELIDRYGKASHAGALEAAGRWRRMVMERSGQEPIRTQVFRADALNREDLIAGLGATEVDLVLTDVPYGLHTEWGGAFADRNPLESLLDNLLGLVSRSGLLAVASSKSQKAEHPFYERVERFQIGKHRIIVLQPLPRTKLPGPRRRDISPHDTTGERA